MDFFKIKWRVSSLQTLYQKAQFTGAEKQGQGSPVVRTSRILQPD